MALPGRFKSIALTAGSPTFSAPDMYVYRAPPIEFFDGQVKVANGRQLDDPEVWPLNTLKLDPEDGIPIKEALFANHNAEMAINVDGQSLVGRSEIDRGPAQKIKPIAPLSLLARQLKLNIAEPLQLDVLGKLTLDPAFHPGGGDVPPTKAFRARVSGTQLAPTGWSQVSFPVADYNIGNHYNTSTSRWTPPLGLIHINAAIYVTSLNSGANVNLHVAIYKNGILLKTASASITYGNQGGLISVDDVANGTDYYEVWVYAPSPALSSIYADTAFSFFSGHVPSGQQGVQGIQGPIGITGPIGPQGIQGIKGDKGDLGNTGPQGIQGIQGPIGFTGLQGPTGDTGAPGATWYQGIATPTAGIGVSGDFYLRTSNGDVFQKSGTTWTLLNNIRGPQGPQGLTGPTGADSTVPGPQGIQGPIGLTGLQGIQGTQGIQGPVGSLWYQGAGAPAVGLGINGDYYLNTTSGDVSLKTAGAWSVVGNIKGPQGIQGIQGNTGSAGPATTWYSGAANPSAALGANGDYFFNTTTLAVLQKSGGTWSQISTLTGGGLAIGFRASKNGVDQTSIPNALNTKVTFGTEDYDRGGYYDPALSRWTPPAGIVHLDAEAFISAGMSAIAWIIASIYKNGGVLRQTVHTSAAATDGFQISIDDVSNGTDYYELWIYISSPSTSTISGSTAYTWFGGHVVSAQGPIGPVGPQGNQGIQGPTGPTGPVSTTPGPVGPPATYPTGAHSFSAHKTADQLIPSATWTKVIFDTEVYDTGLHYDPATSRYTPFAGDAVFIASIYASGLLLGANIYIGIYKNGTLLRATTANNTNGTAQIVCADNANGTDYYEAWVYAYTSGGNLTIPTAENNLVFFQGFQPVGPKGADSTVPGPQGIQGLTGVQGPQGVQGLQGIPGFGIVQILPAPPASPTVGNFWYDTTTGILAAWIDDGNSSQWIQIAPTINLDTSAFVSTDSPHFVGVPTAPTAAPGTSTTQVATTSFAKAEAAAAAAALAAVSYSTQTLTAPQQAQARANINSQPTYSTTPPVSPFDGQLWAYPVSGAGGTGAAGAGTVWMFRYNASSASAHKWEFVGGPPVMAGAVGSMSTVTGNQALTSGPVLTAPRAGDYLVDFGAFIQTTGFSNAYNGWITARRSSPNNDSTQAVYVFSAQFAGGNVSDCHYFFATDAGATFTIIINMNAGYTTSFNNGTLKLTPIRVS